MLVGCGFIGNVFIQKNRFNFEIIAYFTNGEQETTVLCDKVSLLKPQLI